MLESNIKFIVNAPLQDVWNIISEPRLNTHCIPGCVSCKIVDKDRAIWILELKFGPFIKRIELRSKNIKINPPYHGKWVGYSRGIKVCGETTLEEIDDNSTLVFYSLKIDSNSVMFKSIKSYIKEKIDFDVRQYAKNIKISLENC
ncbi:MAG: SRPBCC family protein [Methanosarcinales archaeon]